MAKPVLLSMFPTRARIVDVACGSCGEHIAMVTESANGPLLTVWAPSTNAPAGAGGETLWAMASGPIPHDAPVPVHCYEHGHGALDTNVLREKVVHYRTGGSRQNVPVDVRPDGPPQRQLTG